MINTIHIERLALYAHHGVMPQERVVGAMFYVTLNADVEVSDVATMNDELTGTISYADIINVVREEMQTPSSLLEHLIHRIAVRLLTDFSAIQQLEIRIDKENPPCGVRVDRVGVSLKMTR